MTLILPRVSWIIGVALIAFLLVGYICQIVQSTQTGFKISSYEKQIAEFAKESQNLESSFFQLNSLANLENALAKLNYEKVERIHYLRLPGTVVAAK